MINAPKPGTKVRFDRLDSMTDLYSIARPVPHAQKEI
jgi:hypothetical protein